MPMRSIVAVTAAASSLLLGLWAVSMEASEVESTLSTSEQNAAWNVSVGVYESIGSGGAEALPWFGIAAVVLASLGFLVYASQNGGR